MRIGTKSVLFGAHCFLFHWLFVAAGWIKLYGVQRVQIGAVSAITPEGARYKATLYTSIFDPRLWLAFLLHDLGYLGKPNMDGAEGERHPELGYRIMARCFGWVWGDFCLYHSRFYAKRHGQPVSPLCYADKMAILFEPAWFYLPRVRATGEIHEYMKDAEANSNGEVKAPDQLIWFHEMRAYVRRWIEEHKDGKTDTWTTANREASRSGVWS